MVARPVERFGAKAGFTIYEGDWQALRGSF